MLKEKIITKLIQYKVKFSQTGNSVTIMLGLSQEILVVFSDDNKISITDQLRGWNPLSGALKMSIRNAMILNSLSILFLWIFLLVVFIELELDLGFDFITMFLVFSWGFGLYWSNYYLIKAENFKKTLMNWLDD